MPALPIGIRITVLQPGGGGREAEQFRVVPGLRFRVVPVVEAGGALPGGGGLGVGAL